jgi:hypothetical protein
MAEEEAKMEGGSINNFGDEPDNYNSSELETKPLLSPPAAALGVKKKKKKKKKKNKRKKKEKLLLVLLFFLAVKELKQLVSGCMADLACFFLIESGRSALWSGGKNRHHSHVLFQSVTERTGSGFICDSCGHCSHRVWR